MTVRIGRAASVGVRQEPNLPMPTGRFVGDGRGQPTSSLLDAQAVSVAGISQVWRLQIAILGQALCDHAAKRLVWRDAPYEHVARARHRQIGVVFLALSLGFTVSEIARVTGLQRSSVRDMIAAGSDALETHVDGDSLTGIEDELARVRDRFLAIGAVKIGAPS